jgi:hypothetical protein
VLHGVFDSRACRTQPSHTEIDLRHVGHTHGFLAGTEHRREPIKSCAYHLVSVLAVELL